MNHQFTHFPGFVFATTLFVRSKQLSKQRRAFAVPRSKFVDVGWTVSPFSKDPSTEGEWQTRSGRTNLCQ
jgi:hypothetical protein